VEGEWPQSEWKGASLCFLLAPSRWKGRGRRRSGRGAALLLACTAEVEGEGVAATVNRGGDPPEWKGRGRRSGRRGQQGMREGDEMRANADEYRG